MGEQREALSADAARWLAEQIRWEAQLDRLRRPGGPSRPRRRPRPELPAQRAS